jgi:ABC-type glycerol-3-phosphate transport system substrate-binding protein
MRRRRADEHCWQAALDGDLTVAQAEHLAECDACRAQVEAVRGAASAVRSAAPPMPEGIDARVLVAVAQDAASREKPEQPPATRRRLTWPALGVPHGVAAALAVAAIALAVVLGLRPALQGEEARAVPIIPLTAQCGPKGDGRRLVVAGVWSGPEAEDFARVLGRFEQRTGLKVTYAYETRNIAAKLRARIRRGCAPDVALLPQPGLLSNLARGGDIRPLDAATRAVVFKNYSSTWRQLATVDGQMYGVWFKAADKSTFWYRRSALRAAGIPAAPRTWDAMLADLQRLAAHGTAPLAIAGASPWTLTDWFENLYLQSAGPAAYERLARHELPWTDASVTHALALLARVLGDPRLVATPATALNTSFETSVQQVFGRRPTAAMLYEADFVRNYLRRGADAAFVPFPTLPDSKVGADAAVVGGDVAVGFRSTPGGNRLLRFLATPAAAQPWAQAGGYLSPNRNVPPDDYPDPLTRGAAAHLAGASVVRFDLSDLQPPAFGATAEQGMWGTFQDFLANPGDVTGTARRLEAAARAAWACQRAIAGSC